MSSSAGTGRSNHDSQCCLAATCLDFDNQEIGERLQSLIKGSGAFGRFKNAIHSIGIKNDWYNFKQARLEELAIEWLQEHEIPFSRDKTQDVSGATM